MAPGRLEDLSAGTRKVGGGLGPGKGETRREVDAVQSN